MMLTFDWIVKQFFVDCFVGGRDVVEAVLTLTILRAPPGEIVPVAYLGCMTSQGQGRIQPKTNAVPEPINMKLVKVMAKVKGQCKSSRARW